MNQEPIEIEVLSADKLLRVLWDDGRETRTPLRMLRGYCPCAHCQGHGGGPARFVEVEDPRIVRIDEVGNYALNIVFRDRDGEPPHATGIFAFEYLRELAERYST